jgi:hypothetical protein
VPRILVRGIRGARLDWLVCSLVLGTYTAVQIWLLLGPHPFDPAKYFRTAVDFPHVQADYWTLRIGLIAPVRVAVRAFGPSEAALYAVPLATGMALAAAVYWTMILFFRRRVLAAGAALVTVLNPPMLLNSSFIFPDGAAAATFTVGLLCLILAGSREEHGRRWIPVLGAVLAGLLFGWSYLIRELTLVLLPALAAAVMILRIPLRRLVLVAAMSLAAVGIEFLYGAVQYGDPLVRARELIGRGDNTPRPIRQMLIERLDEQIGDPLDALLVLPRLLLAWDSGWLLVILLGVFLLGLVAIRDRRLWLFGAWFLTVCVAMAVIALVPLPSGEPIVNFANVRYWYPAFPPFVLGAFGTLALLPDRLPMLRRGAAAVGSMAALVALVVIVPGTLEFRSCAAKHLWLNDPDGRWDDLRAWLRTPEAQRYEVLRTDSLTARLVPAFQRTILGDSVWTGRLTEFRRGGPLVPVEARALILVHKERFVHAIPNGEKRLQELSRDWYPVFVSGDGEMVALARRSTAGGVDEASSDWKDLPAVNGQRGGEPGECGLDPYLGR